MGSTQNAHIHRDRQQAGGCQAWKEGTRGVTANGYGISLWGDENWNSGNETEVAVAQC